LSDHSNHRQDEYGGSFENRSRFLIETLAAVRKVWPDHLPLTARLGVIEFDGRDQETLDQSIELIKRFKTMGLDFIDVGVGFSTPAARIPWGPAFRLLSQHEFAKKPACRQQRVGLSASRHRLMASFAMARSTW
ncbi:MAG: hypothetical protein ACLP9L_27915, partial [Thermoguttaceae bacterium]